MTKIQLPENHLSWLNEEVIEKLEAIKGHHATKKRITAIKLAFAKANQRPLEQVFGQDDTCSRDIWNTRWSHNEIIKAAFDACYERVMTWNDEQGVGNIRLPESHLSWLTADIIEKLKAVKGQHAPKKRTTIIKLAFAKANQQPFKQIFNQNDTCSEVIWYTKWQYDEAIKTAFEACYDRAVTWNDEQTAMMEAYYRQQRRQSLARHAAEAPGALAAVMNKEEETGSARISAANSLMTWADPDAAGKAQPHAPASSTDLDISVFAQMSDEQLDRIIKNLQDNESE